jgi:hypothetical protein
MASPTPGIPPNSIVTTLRIEGLVALIAALAAFHLTGGNWWLFAVLILAPDLSFLGALGGKTAGSLTYNLAHTYAAPALLALIAWVAGFGWLYPVVIIWVAHIGADRALGYGLKYSGSFDHTHLGLIGKAKAHAHAR